MNFDVSQIVSTLQDLEKHLTKIYEVLEPSVEVHSMTTIIKTIANAIGL